MTQAELIAAMEAYGPMVYRLALCRMQNAADAEGDLMKRILIYLEDHAAEPITVADAAAHFGYSVGRFSHLFNERIFRLYWPMNFLKPFYIFDDIPTEWIFVFLSRTNIPPSISGDFI